MVVKSAKLIPRPPSRGRCFPGVIPSRIERRALLGQPITVCIPTQGLLNTRYLNGKITKV
ncbi:hypothetical protein ACQPT6_17795 [Erwinia amylovora]|uniref:hypothetical protein n=1 Tax=Erwinia amylovora TaxID=552 RepID=UPI003D008439